MNKCFQHIWLLLVAASSVDIIAAAETIEVDAELVLAVDVSRSMSAAELEIQRRGYAEALAGNEVSDAIARGLLGRVAIQYVEWAGQYNQRVVVDWTLIEGHTQAVAFADQLLAHKSPSMSRKQLFAASHPDWKAPCAVDGAVRENASPANLIRPVRCAKTF